MSKQEKAVFDYFSFVVFVVFLVFQVCFCRVGHGL